MHFADVRDSVAGELEPDSVRAVADALYICTGGNGNLYEVKQVHVNVDTFVSAALVNNQWWKLVGPQFDSPEILRNKILFLQSEVSRLDCELRRAYLNVADLENAQAELNRLALKEQAMQIWSEQLNAREIALNALESQLKASQCRLDEVLARKLSREPQFEDREEELLTISEAFGPNAVPSVSSTRTCSTLLRSSGNGTTSVSSTSPSVASAVPVPTKAVIDASPSRSTSSPLPRAPLACPSLVPRSSASPSASSPSSCTAAPLTSKKPVLRKSKCSAKEVSLFLAEHAICDLKKEGVQALHLACSSQRGNEEMAVWLVTEAGVDVNGRSGEWTPLFFAVVHDRLSLAQFLLDSGADVHAKGPLGVTTLTFACVDAPKCAKLLLEHGALVDAVDGNGNSPLHIAARYGQVEILEMLVNYGANVDAIAKDENQATPLHVAVTHAKLEAAKILIEMGANANIQNKAALTPLQLAEKTGNPKNLEIIQLLKRVTA